MLDYCVNNNYEFLCTLDQDSVFEYDDINKMKQFIKKYYDEKIVIYSPKINYKHVTDANNSKQIPTDYNEVDWVITSGSFINIPMVSKYNIKYDEKYFIDRCDLDFCKQIRNNNLKIVVNNKAKLYQELGSLTNNGFPEHNALRHYYIFRNRLYFNKKYYPLLKREMLNITQTINQLRTILLYESDKFNKFKQLVYAIYDYLHKISGEVIR